MRKLAQDLLRRTYWASPNVGKRFCGVLTFVALGVAALTAHAEQIYPPKWTPSKDTPNLRKDSVWDKVKLPAPRRMIPKPEPAQEDDIIPLFFRNPDVKIPATTGTPDTAQATTNHLVLPPIPKGAVQGDDAESNCKGLEIGPYPYREYIKDKGDEKHPPVIWPLAVKIAACFEDLSPIAETMHLRALIRGSVSDLETTVDAMGVGKSNCDDVDKVTSKTPEFSSQLSNIRVEPASVVVGETLTVKVLAQVKVRKCKPADFLWMSADLSHTVLYVNVAVPVVLGTRTLDLSFGDPTTTYGSYDMAEQRSPAERLLVAADVTIQAFGPVFGAEHWKKKQEENVAEQVRDEIAKAISRLGTQHLSTQLPEGISHVEFKNPRIATHGSAVNFDASITADVGARLLLEPTLTERIAAAGLQ
jgi:hypothetical protein